MSEKKYSKQHEWVTIEGDVATIGITTHAAEMLGDVVFVELPEKGKNVEKEGQAGVVAVSYTHLTLPTNREV